MKIPFFVMLLPVDFLSIAGIFKATPDKHLPLAFVLVTGAHVLIGLAYAIYSTIQVKVYYANQLQALRRQSDQSSTELKDNLRRTEALTKRAFHKQGGFVTGEFIVGLLGLGLVTLGVTVAREWTRNPPVMQTLLGLWAGSALVFVAAISGVILMIMELKEYL